jgi:Uma2 family endonuclease
MSTELLTTSHRLIAPREWEVEYPDGDGKPMAETGPHVAEILKLWMLLRHWLKPQPRAFTAANMFLYYLEGDPVCRVSPDVFAVWGVANAWRRSFKLWEEKQAPHVVFEITSRKTIKHDLGRKKRLYAQLGVEEYYLFDVYGEYLAPPLRGYQLAAETYAQRKSEKITPRLLPAHARGLPITQEQPAWRLLSARLQLELWVVPTDEALRPYELRLYAPQKGKWLADPERALIDLEMYELQAREAQARAEYEIMKREAAEARAQQEAGKREAAEALIKQEAEARRLAEARIAQLEAEVKRLRG